MKSTNKDKLIDLILTDKETAEKFNKRFSVDLYKNKDIDLSYKVISDWMITQNNFLSRVYSKAFEKERSNS